jgi:hypothetical protein
MKGDPVNSDTDSFLGKTTVPSHVTDEEIEHILEELFLTGWKIMVLHLEPPIALR